MRIAGALVIFLAFVTGCQPGISPSPSKDIIGVWLRSDQTFTNGVSRSGTTSSFEIFEANYAYMSVVHSFSGSHDQYQIVRGTWNVNDGKMSLAYTEQYTFSSEESENTYSVMLGGALTSLLRLDHRHLEYEHPQDGRISLVKGEIPKDVDQKMLEKEPKRPTYTRPDQD